MRVRLNVTADREDFWSHVIAAGSYVGVEPF